jgi:hypothetical protein
MSSSVDLQPTTSSPDLGFSAPLTTRRRAKLDAILHGFGLPITILLREQAEEGTTGISGVNVTLG